MDLSIERFWKERFSGVQKGFEASEYEGWLSNCQSEESYVQARLSLRDGYSDLEQSVWLIAAPGAVGKSTLAKEICAATGAVYLDLAVAATVGGSCITGGLYYSNILPLWTEGKAALVIDALDEARLRVTQPAFEDFLKDVLEVSKRGKFPVVLLGRVGIIEESWTIFNESAGKEFPILNIELFEGEESVQFVYRRLEVLSRLVGGGGELEYPHLGRSLESHAKVYQEAIHNVVNGLREVSPGDGNGFVGYAPVLDAVAKVIAAEQNPSRINDELRQVLEGEVLVRLSEEVLRRETGKLIDQLQESIPDLPQGLYSPGEQLEYLACKLFKLQFSPVPDQLSPHQRQRYADAVQNLLPQHPFLNGSGKEPSNAVFAACIISAALRSKRADLQKRGEQYAKFIHHAPNPFLYDFYKYTSEEVVKAEHIGLIFESVLAKSKLGESVSLFVEESGKEVLFVEIVRKMQNNYSSVMNFNADGSGLVRLGRRVSNVSIDASELYVELGTGDLLELVAPVAINCHVLEFSCQHVSVKGEPHDVDDSVTLEAGEISAGALLTAPVVRGSVQFRVTWPEAVSYPWTEFASAEREFEDPKLAALIRVFRRLVMAFRSHSKGRLARFKDKIEHARMLKGEEGSALLEKLIQDKIVSLEGTMYYLDANMLGARTGASFLDVNLKRYSPKTISYLQAIL